MKKGHFLYSIAPVVLALEMGGVPPVPVPTDIPGVNLEGLERGELQVGDIRVQTGSDGANVLVGDIEVNTSWRGASVRAGGVEVQTSENHNVISVGDMRIELQDAAEPVFSLRGLERSIEVRDGELEAELASTTERVRDILANANQVRLAVHALLASKELLGGIGTEVSEVARQFNNSVATTTNAETRVRSRNFFSRLFFGGDRNAADEIAQTVNANQKRIQKLSELIKRASVAADVEQALKTQIEALTVEQERLQDLAKKEKGQWGIFSWRFF